MNFFQKITMKKIKTQLNDYLNMNVIELSKGNNIKLRIWYKYHMAEMKHFSALFNFNWLYGP